MSSFVRGLLSVAPLEDAIVEEIACAYGSRFSSELGFSHSAKGPHLGFDTDTGLRQAAAAAEKTATNRTDFFINELLDWNYGTIFDLAVLSFSLRKQLGDGSSALSRRAWVLFLGLCEGDPHYSVRSVIGVAQCLAKSEAR